MRCHAWARSHIVIMKDEQKDEQTNGQAIINSSSRQAVNSLCETIKKYAFTLGARHEQYFF